MANLNKPALPALHQVIGSIPYRVALAGGWIDQPFVSRHNPDPPGSMVVVGIEPFSRFMDRSGMASGTRQIALKRWNGQLPQGDPAALVRELYEAENQGKPEPSGSQDMIGLIYPGINRLDYDFTVHGGVFPSHIESRNEPELACWLERVLYILPVGPRPPSYNPLGEKNMEGHWIARLGQSGKDCFEAICRENLEALGASMNECMKCWEAILPHTVCHPALTINLKSLLAAYQKSYAGAMYSGCGGGYLLVVSDEPVPGAFQIRIRRGDEHSEL